MNSLYPSTILCIPLTYETALDYLHTLRSTDTGVIPLFDTYGAVLHGSLFFTLLDRLRTTSTVTGKNHRIGSMRRKECARPTNSSSAHPTFLIPGVASSTCLYGTFHLPSVTLLSFFRWNAQQLFRIPYPHFPPPYTLSSSALSSSVPSPVTVLFLYIPAYRYDHPDYLFAYYLNRMNNLYVRIERENAYISSLGGGAYLCRHIPLAIRAAYTQIYLSFLINDIILFTRSIVHLIYIAIAAGQWGTANHIIKVLRTYGRESNDSGLLRLIDTAQHYLVHTKQWYRLGILNLSPIHIIQTITKPTILATTKSASTTTTENLQTDSSSSSPLSSVTSPTIPEEQYMKDPRYDDIYRQRITKYRGRII